MQSTNGLECGICPWRILLLNIEDNTYHAGDVIIPSQCVLILLLSYHTQRGVCGENDGDINIYYDYHFASDTYICFINTIIRKYDMHHSRNVSNTLYSDRPYQRMFGSPIQYHYNDLKISWWRHQMETFSALLAVCAGNSPVTGEFPSQRSVSRSFDVFFDLRLNKQLSKQWWGWWFET